MLLYQQTKNGQYSHLTRGTYHDASYCGCRSLSHFRDAFATSSCGGAHPTDLQQESGDFLGTDHKCHHGGDKTPRLVVDEVVSMDPAPTPEATPAPEHTPEAERPHDDTTFKMFTDRCAEQALKRAKIYGHEVTPEMAANPEKGGTCHVQGGFVERGAI